MVNIRTLFLIPLILYFLPSLVIFVGSSSYIVLAVIFVSVFSGLYLFLNYKSVFSYIKILYTKTPAKYFIWLYIWLIISGFLAVLCGYYSFIRFLFFIYIAGIFKFALLYFYPSMVIPKYFSLKSFIKIFVFMYLATLLWGIVEFIGIQFHISIIEQIENIISGIQKYESFTRVRSFHVEPGGLGRFIAVNLPIIYSLSLSKFKIFGSKIVNYIIKILLIILSVICIFLTKSPIFILFFLFITGIYFLKPTIFFFKKSLALSLLFTFILIVFIYLLDFIMFSDISADSNTYLQRIIRVVGIFNNFSVDRLIMADASLATRVINAINHFHLFLKHPFIGIGFGNVGQLLINQLMNSPVPLTYEIQSNIIDARTTIGANSNATFTLLHQSGLIAFILYCIFMIKSMTFFKKIKHYFSQYEKRYISALIQSILIMFVLSIIYNQPLLNETLQLYTGLVPAIIIIAMQRKNNIQIVKNELVKK